MRGSFDDAFWRLHDKLVGMGARRQRLRFYPKKDIWRTWKPYIPLWIAVAYILGVIFQ